MGIQEGSLLKWDHARDSQRFGIIIELDDSSDIGPNGEYMPSPSYYYIMFGDGTFEWISCLRVYEAEVIR